MIVRKILVCVLSAFLLLFGGELFAKPNLNNVNRLIKQGGECWNSNPELAEKRYRQAFDEAMYFTRPQVNKNVREKALALATSCLHPALFVEVRLAIETYLSIFESGRNRAQVFFNKAILQFAEGRALEGVATLSQAEKIAKGWLLKRTQWLKFHGLVRARHYRSAESYLNELKGKRSLKRFDSGEKQISKTLTDQNSIPTFESLKKLETQLAHTYFAQSAPDAELLLLVGKDSAQPLYHGFDVDFQELRRVSFHHLSPNMRVKKLENFLNEYPEAYPQLIGNTMLELRSIHLYELKDPVTAEYWRAQLAGVQGFAEKAEIESLLEKLSCSRIDSPEALKCLYALRGFKDFLPYDNGWLPVFDFQQLNELLAAALLLNDKSKQAFDTVKLEYLNWRVGTIPAHLLFLIAVDMKSLANRKYQELEFPLSNRDDKLINDFLFPLWEMINPTERRLLSAYLISPRFPKIAIDLLLKEITGDPVHNKLDYGFALLADLYQGYRNYVEAQDVWMKMRELHPRSQWIQ